MNRNLKWALAIVALATSAPALAGWGYKVITDPLTDVKRGISTLSSNSGLVVIKCDDNGPGSLYFSVISDTYLETSSSYRVKEMKYRFDGGAVETIDA